MDIASTEPVPKLTKLCSAVLVRYRSCLTNVGWLEPGLLRGVLAYCNAEELTAVEDATRHESNRDLCWYTWDFWARLYEQKFGQHKVQKATLKPLPGKPPVDYVAPKTAVAPTADWRTMLERDLAAEQEKADAMSNKLRNMYDKVSKDRQDRSAQVCIIKPPMKRMRTGAGAAITFASEQEKSKAKMLHGLGLVSSSVAAGRVVGRVDKPAQRPASRGVVAYTPTHLPRHPSNSWVSPSSSRHSSSSTAPVAALPKTAGFSKSSTPFMPMPVDPHKPAVSNGPSSHSGSRGGAGSKGRDDRPSNSVSSSQRKGGPPAQLSSTKGGEIVKRTAPQPAEKKPDLGPLGLLSSIGKPVPVRR